MGKLSRPGPRPIMYLLLYLFIYFSIIIYVFMKVNIFKDIR